MLLGCWWWLWRFSTVSRCIKGRRWMRLRSRGCVVWLGVRLGLGWGLARLGGSLLCEGFWGSSRSLLLSSKRCRLLSHQIGCCALSLVFFEYQLGKLGHGVDRSWRRIEWMSFLNLNPNLWSSRSPFCILFYFNLFNY